MVHDLAGTERIGAVDSCPASPSHGLRASEGVPSGKTRAVGKNPRGIVPLQLLDHVPEGATLT